jgi:hypothetical protein
MTNYTVKLSKADLNMIFRGLASWCGEQSNQGNPEGANETRELYNRLGAQTILRAPLHNEPVWMKDRDQHFIQYASGRVIRWQLSRGTGYSTRATPDDGICLYMGDNFSDAVLALPQNAIHRQMKQESA